MQKIQILFPDPMMARLRLLAQREDVPLSEIVRKATAQWLERFPKEDARVKSVPLINAGRCLLDADAMKEALHE
ncbi:MAG: ribbon-helix-helix protein, CopG family [Chthoniobacterales bacterium]